MVFNESKCKVLHIGRNNNEQQYELNGVVLSKTEAEKDIGVIIHKSLKPHDHCMYAR